MIVIIRPVCNLYVALLLYTPSEWNSSDKVLTVGSGILLLLALGLALSFEFVNGFHDTANAVATVIYTHTLKPTYAVVWSGCWNLIGVLTSTGAVAFGILALLPVELVLNVGSGAGFAMVFALLISAIIWNLGTWYLGLAGFQLSHTGRSDHGRRPGQLRDVRRPRIRRRHQLGQGDGSGHVACWCRPSSASAARRCCCCCARR